jgi:nicotinamide-nucleotide amidase
VSAARHERVGLVSIGDELVSGRIVDRNSGEIAARLLELGFEVSEVRVLPDDEEKLARAFVDLCAEHGVVVATGGLGPTLDDVTRHAAARAAGVGLTRSEEALVAIRAAFAGRSFAMGVSNERQALLPDGARMLPNPVGTAPGFSVEIGGALVFALPGPPVEMRRMLEDHVLTELTASIASAVATRTTHLFGLSESVFADGVQEWMRRDVNPLVGVTAHAGVLTVTVRARGVGLADASDLADARLFEIEAAFREHVFSRPHGDLARVLGELLVERGISVATAESCTGGLLAARLTAVPGISAVFREGFVTYADEAKARTLGVPAELLARHGAVSAEVAAALSRGAAERTGARLALSVTGIAGPGGGSPAKPVGLVHFGVLVDGRVETVERRFPDRGRSFVRGLAVNTALFLGLRALS